MAGLARALCSRCRPRVFAQGGLAELPPRTKAARLLRELGSDLRTLHLVRFLELVETVQNIEKSENLIVGDGSCGTGNTLTVFIKL